MRVVLRTDAGPSLGTGHMMRCLALAHAWKELPGEAVFLSAAAPDWIGERIREAGFELQHVAGEPGSLDDARDLASRAREWGADAVVVDGYAFGAAYQQALKDAGLVLLAIDDYGHAERYMADLVVNQNIYASEALYPRRSAETRLLLGTRYALLRPEFAHRSQPKRAVAPEARNVLVTLGGADPPNATLSVIQALRQVRVPFEAQVVLGASNPRRAELEHAAGGSGAIRLLPATPDIPALMEWADVAIAGAGTTCWELAFMGVPSLLLVLAENQRPIAEGLAQLGAAVNLGEATSADAASIAQELQALLASAERRALLSQRMRSLVDGKGAERVGRELARVAAARTAQPGRPH